MDHAFGVGGVEGAADLLDDADRFLWREFAGTA